VQNLDFCQCDQNEFFVTAGVEHLKFWHLND
jgi:hypothetical protein